MMRGCGSGGGWRPGWRGLSWTRGLRLGRVSLLQDGGPKDEESAGCAGLDCRRSSCRHQRCQGHSCSAQRQRQVRRPSLPVRRATRAGGCQAPTSLSRSSIQGQPTESEDAHGGDDDQKGYGNRHAQGRHEALADEPADKPAACHPVAGASGSGFPATMLAMRLEDQEQDQRADQAVDRQDLVIGHLAECQPDAERAEQERHQPGADAEEGEAGRRRSRR